MYLFEITRFLWASSFLLSVFYVECANASNIKNVVLLVMENRSFDNLLGYWAKLKPQNGAEGIPDKAGNIFSKTGEFIHSEPNMGYINEYNPAHDFSPVQDSIRGTSTSSKTHGTPSMSGFIDVASVAWNTTDPVILAQVMNGFHPENLPITVALVEEFAVFDHWFSSVPGPTYPNRAFIMSASSNGTVVNSNHDVLFGYPQKSIFKNLEESNISWKNYFGIFPTSLFMRDVRTISNILTKLKPMESFYNDAKKGTLPQFSYIDPVLISAPGFPANDNHPPHDVARGEMLLKNVYEALRNGPQWHSTLFLITYDEHGGYFDHIVPPSEGVPSPDAASENSAEFKFNRLGLRVPTIAISPWIKKGRVVKSAQSEFHPPWFHNPFHRRPHPKSSQLPSRTSQFSHSSISHTLTNIFNLNATLNNRDAWAAPFDFLTMELDEVRFDCPKVLPDAPRLTKDMEDRDNAEEWEGLMNVWHAISGRGG